MSLFGNVVQLASDVYQLGNSTSSMLSTISKAGFSKVANGGGGQCIAIEDMFFKNGLSYDQMMKSFLSAKEQLEQTQHADLFHFEIIRQAPSYPLDKSLIISSMVTGVEITTEGLNAEEVAVGSSFYNELKDIQSGEVQVTFLESQNGDVQDFLTKRVFTDIKSGASFLQDMKAEVDSAMTIGKGVNSALGTNIPLGGLGQISGILGAFNVGTARFGDDVLPTDGTYLLPYDYYFSIKLSHLIRVNGQTVEKVMIKDDFILDGGVQSSYTTGDEQYLTKSATFKKIQGWEL